MRRMAVLLSPDLSYDRRGKVAWVQLCRAQYGNRLTPAMVEELVTLCEMAEEDDGIAVVVLTGNGDVFCHGLEYTRGSKKLTAAQEIRSQFGEVRCIAALAAITKPTLAALNGDAIGIGLELALACDLRLAIAGARFSLSQVADGLIPFCGGTQRLPRIVGQAKALELVLTGDSVEAQEALRIGLVNQVSTAEQFTTRVEEVLANLLEKGPTALRLGKEAVHKAMDLTLDQGIRLEEDLYALLQTTRDRAEGVRSFLKKRRPRFTGQ